MPVLQPTKKSIGLLPKFLAALIIAAGIFYIVKTIASNFPAGEKHPPSASAQPAAPAPEAHRPDPQAIGTMSENAEAMLTRHDTLPATSPWGLNFLGESQESNTQSVMELTALLGRELGSTPALDSIRQLQDLKTQERDLELLTRSNDPETAQEAQANLESNRRSQKSTIEKVRQELASQGVNLSIEQARALCLSPNAEDSASLLTSFAAFKTVSLQMEATLRHTPTQSQAQKYYGAHYVMLRALDLIQRRCAENIAKAHQPKAAAIAGESALRQKEAQSLLLDPETSPSERAALEANIESFATTGDLARKTAEKLQANLQIILESNRKLQSAIKTAQNSHASALLQKEILLLAQDQDTEFQRIRNLEAPNLAAINFADPTSPVVSPSKPVR
jgi:hypothetical protein